MNHFFNEFFEFHNISSQRAQLRLCSYWPARVVNPPPEVGTGGQNKICVLFFGTKN